MHFHSRRPRHPGRAVRFHRFEPGAFAELVERYCKEQGLFRPDDTLIPDEAVAASVGTDIINLRNDLEKVNFDQSLFASPGYLGLIDFSIAIPQLPVGRVNPFANIGRD